MRFIKMIPELSFAIICIAAAALVSVSAACLIKSMIERAWGISI